MGYMKCLQEKPGWVFIIGFILTVPALFSGWLGDDYLHYAMLHPQISIPAPNDWSLFGLFSWVDASPERNRALMDLGVLPWWITEDFRSQFWRPVAELSHWLDHHLWRDSPFLMHLHSNLWYLAAGAVLYKLYRLLALPAYASVLALALFLWDSTHGFTVAWVANRNAILATFFAGLCLIYFVKWQQQADRRCLLLSLLFFVLCLLSGEIGVSVGAYLFAYVLMVERPRRWAFLVSLWPYACVLVLWWSFYKLGNFGATNWQSAYIDPWEDPLLFMARVFERLPIIFMAQFGLVPADVFGFAPHIDSLAIASIVVFLALLLVVLMPLLQGSALARFWALGTVLAALPLGTTIPADRNLLFVGIGASALLGLLLDAVSRRLITTRFSRYGAYTLFAFHLVLAPIFMLGMSYSTRLLGQAMALETNKKLPVNSKQERVLLFGLNMPIALSAMPMRFADHLMIPENLWLISSQPTNYTIERTGPAELTVESATGMINKFEQSIRDISISPLNVGDVVRTNKLQFEIEKLDSSGHPVTLQIRFEPHVIDDAIIIYWDGKEFGRAQLPKMGKSVTLHLG